MGEKEQVRLFVAVHSVLALQFAQSLKASGFTVLLILKPRLCEPCWLFMLPVHTCACAYWYMFTMLKAWSAADTCPCQHVCVLLTSCVSVIPRVQCMVTSYIEAVFKRCKCFKKPSVS